MKEGLGLTLPLIDCEDRNLYDAEQFIEGGEKAGTSSPGELSPSLEAVG